MTDLQWNWKKGTNGNQEKGGQSVKYADWADGLSCLEKKDGAIKSRFRFLQVERRMAPICSSAFGPSSKNN